MKLYDCVIPQIDVNDKQVTVDEFRFQDGDFVNKMETILSLETAKAVSEFYTEETGYIAYVVEEGDELSIGDIVAKIFDNKEEAVKLADDLKQQRELEKPTYKATAKAIRLAEELGVDLNAVQKNGIIREADVQSHYDENRS